MRRTKKSIYADVILVSDLHLTDITPVARTDDYMQAQINKLQFLQTLSNKNDNCPILCAGDVFDKWKTSPWLTSTIFKYLPRPFIAIPGQHDLPGHSLSLYPKSGLALLESIDKDIHILQGEEMRYKDNLQIIGIPFGLLKDFRSCMIDLQRNKCKILLLHELTWKSKKPDWATNSYTAKQLLDRFADFDLIVTGDNHLTFDYKDKGKRILVNPGSMLRSTAGQINHTPCCYLYYSGSGKTEKVLLPIKKDVITIEHLEEKKDSKYRVGAYIEQMNKDWEIGLSFEQNLKTFFEKNRTPKKVRDVIWRHLEKETV